MPSRLRSLLARPGTALLIPLLLATAAYWRVLDGEFQFDDTHTVERNLAVKDLGGYVSNRLVAEYLNAGRPTTDLTFAFNYAVGRLEPWNYHLTNLVIHLGVVLLVYAFTRLVLRLAGAARPEWLAVAVAGVFALHPIQSEAVAYVSQRAESLASGLYLATLLLVLAAERRGLTARAAPLWGAAFLCFLVALGAKAIVVTLPAAWLLLAGLVPDPEHREQLLGWKQRLLAVVPFVGFDLLFVSRTLGGIEGHGDAGFSVPGLPPWTYLITQFRVILVYLRLLFWPAGQNADWDFPASRSLAEPEVLLSGVALVALGAGALALALWARPREGEGAGAARVAGVGILWFFLVLSVTSSVVPLADVLVEHRLYLACWGIFVAVAVGLERLVARAPRARTAAAGGAVLALLWAAPAAALHGRNGVWETRRALWVDSAAKSPRKARPHLSLAYAALMEGRYQESIDANQHALALAGRDVSMQLQIYRNLGASQLLLGKADDAEATLRRAVDAGHWDADILNNLAVVLIEKRKLDEAETYARRAVTVEPGKGEGWNTLGEITLRRGNPAEALKLFERSSALDPDVQVRHYNRGLAMAMMGRVPEACAVWARVNPAGDPGLQQNLGRAWADHRCGGKR